ncbi:MAG: hypothetical protein CMH52_04315 [Myxococcales bacterium]|nr:hypothetical protein [Myxococcales bacterium]|tara:strand:+ start:72 stop:797 length:726 start_codon:yes stop_codon:yes gene_type:complete
MLPMVKPLTKTEKEQLADRWVKLAKTSHVLKLRIDALTQALRVHGTTSTVLTLCLQASADIEKYMTVAQRVAMEFGATDDFSTPVRPGPLAPTTMGIEQKVLYEVVYCCCVKAAVDGAIFGRIYEQCKWPSVKLAAHIILEAKIWQGRLGWAHLGAAIEKVPTRWIEQHILSMLKNCFEEHTHALSTVSKSRLDYGLVDSQTFTAVFCEVVNTVILPGFESLSYNIESSRLWIKNIPKTTN